MSWFTESLKKPFGGMSSIDPASAYILDKTPVLGELQREADDKVLEWGLPTNRDVMDPGGFFHPRDSKYYKYDPFNKGFYADDAAQTHPDPIDWGLKPVDQIYEAPGGLETLKTITYADSGGYEYAPNNFSQQSKGFDLDSMMAQILALRNL
jgi:hypothetical protein